MDYLNNSYSGGYMMDFSGTLRFGGDKYFSELLNSMGTINEIVGKDIFNSDINLDLAKASLQIQIPGIVADAGSVPSYFRFGGLTKLPLSTDIFGESIRKYIPVFPPPATQQFIFVSAGPTKDDYSIFLEGGARVHVPKYGDIDLGSAYFYISLNGIEMGSSSDMTVGPFHIDGDLRLGLGISSIKVHGNFSGPNNFSLSGRLSNLTVGDLNFSLSAAVTAGNISLKASGTYKGQGVTITIVPDWEKHSVKACVDLILADPCFEI